MAIRKSTKNTTETTSDNVNISSWPTKADAARALKVSVSTVQRMVDRKELNPELDESTGVWHFDPGELALLRDQQSELTVQEVMQAAVRLADQSQAHAEAFGKLVLPNSAKMIDMLFAEIADLRERAGVRIAELERKLAESFEAREAALSQAHERQLELEAFRAEETRKTQIMDLLQTQIAPKLVEQIGASGKVVSLVRSIDPGLLALLKEQLTAEQWEAVQSMLGEPQRMAIEAILAKDKSPS